MEDKTYFVYIRDGIYGISEDTEDNKEFKSYISDGFAPFKNNEMDSIVEKIDAMNKSLSEERAKKAEEQVNIQRTSNYLTLVDGGLSKEAAALLTGYKEGM